MIVITSLVWERRNEAHIARHGVTHDEVEEVCGANPVTSETYAGRIRAIGLTRLGRTLTLILAPKGEGVYYPVTARPASRKERRIYTCQRGGEQEI